MCNIRLLCKEMCVQERRASAQYACTFVNAHFTGHVHISHRTRAVGLQTRPGRLLQGDDHRRLHSSRASLLWKEQHLPKWLMALTLRRQAGRQEAGHHNWMSQSRCPCLIYWAGLPSWALWDEGGRKADGGEGLWRKGKRERLRRRKWGSEEKGEANTLNTFLGARGKRKESGKRKGKSCRIIKKKLVYKSEEEELWRRSKGGNRGAGWKSVLQRKWQGERDGKEERQCVTQTRLDIKAGRGNKAVEEKDSERLETMVRKRVIIEASINEGVSFESLFKVWCRD